jgi:hypothetical protein
MPRLNPGDPFPKLTLSTTDGQVTTVPDAFACDFGVVLFYPGAARRARRQARRGQPAETDGSLTMRQKHGLAFTVVSDAGNGLADPCAGELPGSPVPALAAPRPVAVSSARRG